jgi:Ca2+/H+ antiporter, TMEM165/GDT1 family
MVPGAMLPIIFYTYGAVFMAEIVGDKLLYTTGVLATRYRTLPILCGMAMAFMLKMGVAVLVGHFVSTLPKWLVATITAINFFAIAFVLWRKPDKREVKPQQYPVYRAALVAFAAIFFSEWGDVGQITAATMAAKFNYPLAVWLGAVAAMVTKGTLASFIGGGVRGWIQAHFEPKTLRYAAVALLLVLGMLSVWEILFENEGPAMLLYFVR